MTASNEEKIRKIYEALPKRNCGLCGYDNCGLFAKAVAEGKASPFGCRQNPWAGYRISEIIGAEVPTYPHRFQPVSLPELRVSASTMNLKALTEELKELSQGVDDILIRIEKLKMRR